MQKSEIKRLREKNLLNMEYCKTHHPTLQKEYKLTLYSYTCTTYIFKYYSDMKN